MELSTVVASRAQKLMGYILTKPPSGEGRPDDLAVAMWGARCQVDRRWALER